MMTTIEESSVALAAVSRTTSRTETEGYLKGQRSPSRLDLEHLNQPGYIGLAA